MDKSRGIIYQVFRRKHFDSAASIVVAARACLILRHAIARDRGRLSQSSKTHISATRVQSPKLDWRWWKNEMPLALVLDRSEIVGWGMPQARGQSREGETRRTPPRLHFTWGIEAELAWSSFGSSCNGICRRWCLDASGGGKNCLSSVRWPGACLTDFHLYILIAIPQLAVLPILLRLLLVYP